MKTFLKKTGYIALICFIPLISLEFLLFSQENEYSYKCHYIENHLNDIKVLTLGASSFEVSVDPSIIGDSVFNGNLSGISDLYKNSATYQMAFRYVPQMHNLKVLIIPCAIANLYRGSNDWHFMSDPGSRNSQCMKVKYLNVYEDWRDIVYWSEFANSSMDFMGRFEKTDEETRNCDSLGLVSTGRDIENRKEGWENAFVEHNVNNFLKGKTRKDTWALIEGYDDVAELCKKHGVRLIGVATPYYKTMLKEITPSVKADYKYALSEIRKKHPEVEFFDYTNDKRFTSDDFQDAVHLNNVGAKKFSKILKDEVLEIK